jgi:hypothetical protein
MPRVVSMPHTRRPCAEDRSWVGQSVHSQLGDSSMSASVAVAPDCTYVN